MMKKTLATIAAIMLGCIMSFATPQKGDVLIIKGQEWQMAARPLDNLDEESWKALRQIMPAQDRIITSNIHGYTAYWTLQDEKLYLTKIEVEGTGEELWFDDLKGAFGKYVVRGRIEASWFSGILPAHGTEKVDYLPLMLERESVIEMPVKIEKGNLKDNGEMTEKEGIHNFQYGADFISYKWVKTSGIPVISETVIRTKGTDKAKPAFILGNTPVSKPLFQSLTNTEQRIKHKPAKGQKTTFKKVFISAERL